MLMKYLFNIKFLLSLSSFMSGASIFTMGAYSSLKDLNYDLLSFTWVPVVCLTGVVAGSAIGMRQIPYVVAAELLPQNVCSSYSQARPNSHRFLFVCYRCVDHSLGT